jgi:hypothetical protein
MKACYIDESGHCGKTYNPDQPVEVIVGVMTDFYGLFKTQREQDGIIKKLNDLNIPIAELKASQMYRGRGSWHGIDYKARYNVMEQILQWSADRKCKFIVSPIDGDRFFTRKKGGCQISQLVHFPYESGAFNTILAVQRMNDGEGNNKGKTVMVFDEQSDHDGRILNLLDSDLTFTDGFTGYVYKPKSKNNPPRLGEVVDVPFFSKSHLSKAIQLADLAAFVVNKYLLLTVYGQAEKFPGELELITKWYLIIGEQRITHTHVNPKACDDLTTFYHEIRPDGWTYKKWTL